MGNDINNLSGSNAANKIKELADSARICIMMTDLDKRPISARPMAIQKTDDQGRIYFFSEKNSLKNEELRQSQEMQLTLSNEKNSEYLNVFGHADVYRDQEEIDEMYSAFVNTWFDGKKDPNITIIRFTPEAGHYWDTKHGKLIQLAGMLVGAVTGKQTDDGIEGRVKL